MYKFFPVSQKNIFPVSQNFSLCQSKIPCVFPVWKKWRTKFPVFSLCCGHPVYRNVLVSIVTNVGVDGKSTSQLTGNYTQSVCVNCLQRDTLYIFTFWQSQSHSVNKPQALTGQGKKVNELFNTFLFCASQASDNWLLFDDVWFWSVRAEWIQRDMCV